MAPRARKRLQTLLFLAGAGAAAGIGLLTAGRDIGLAGSSFMSGCTAVVLASLVQLRQTLVATEEGVTYRLFPFRTFSPWSSIGGIGEERIAGVRTTAEFLVLTEPAKRLFGSFLFRRTKVGRRIPLSIFDPAWRTGALGADLRRWAPHVFG